MCKDKLWQVSQKVNSDSTWHHFRQNVDVKGRLLVTLCISLSIACSSFWLFSDYRLSFSPEMIEHREIALILSHPDCSECKKALLSPSPSELNDNFLNMNALKCNSLIEKKCLIVKFYLFSWKKTPNNKTKCVLNAIFHCTD